MKRYILIIALVLILFVALLPTLKLSCIYINKFDTLSNTQMFERNYELQKDSLRLFDIYNRKDTTIAFKGTRLISFWASWCKPCIEEFSSLQALREKYPETKINLISFEEKDTAAQKKILVSRGISLPAFILKDTQLFKIPKLLPRNIIIKNRIVIWDFYVSRDWMSDEMTHIFDSLLTK